MSSMIHLLYLVVLSLMTPILTQDCSSLTIEAIYPCTANFTIDTDTNQCMLSSCYTQSPGNPLNQTNITTCFISCCPGFVIPSLITKNAMMPCYNKFNSSPDLVYIIGILIVVFLSAICICLPCCTNKECPIYRGRQKLVDCLAVRRVKVRKQEKKDEIQESKLMMNEKSYVQDPIGLDIDIIIEQQDDNTSSSENVCLLCSKNKANSRLTCKHYYHLDCLANSWAHLNCCPLCENKNVFPLHFFCQKCFRTYMFRSSLAKPNQPYVCSNCKS